MSTVRLGQAYPLRSAGPDLLVQVGKWTGGGAAADMSVTDGDANHGIASVEYDGATGKYLVTFAEVGEQLVHCDAKVHRPTTGDDPIVSNIRIGTLDRDAMTVAVEFGATLADIDTDEKVTFLFVWTRSAP